MRFYYIIKISYLYEKNVKLTENVYPMSKLCDLNILKSCLFWVFIINKNLIEHSVEGQGIHISCQNNKEIDQCLKISSRKGGVF